MNVLIEDLNGIMKKILLLLILIILPSCKVIEQTQSQ